MSTSSTTPATSLGNGSGAKVYRTPQKVTFLEDTEKDNFKRRKIPESFLRDTPLAISRNEVLPPAKRQKTQDEVQRGKEKVKEYDRTDPDVSSLNIMETLPSRVEDLDSYKRRPQDFHAADSTIAISDDEDEELLARMKETEKKYLLLQQQMLAAQESRQNRQGRDSYQRWKNAGSGQGKLPTEEDLYAQTASRQAGNMVAGQVSRGRTIKEVEVFKQLKSYQDRQRARQSQEVSGEGSEEAAVIPQGLNSRGLSYLIVYLSAHQEKDFRGNPAATATSRFLGPNHKDNFLSLINMQQDPDVTSARAMIYGAIYMLDDLPDNVDLMVYSDSKYFVDSINKGWVSKWISTGWGDHKHEDLWVPFMQKLSVRQGGAKWEFLDRGDWREHPYMRIASQVAVQTCKDEL